MSDRLEIVKKNQSSIHTAKQEYDLIVVGAGIQGAGVAQAAALNGLNTLVIEKNEEAALATSSKSSKLIHGGLRYLETLSFSLVRECLLERERLLANAPHLVQENRFYIPVYKSSKRFWPVIYLGLWLYSFLGGDFSGKKIGRLPKQDWSTLSGLKTDGLRAVLYYEDAQTDDKKLTEAVMKSFIDLKGQVMYRRKVVAVKVSGGGFLVDTINASEADQSKQQLKLRAKNFINAAGPWVNELARSVRPLPNTIAVDLVQGTHIVIDRQISSHCFYGESPDDSRAVFVLPWNGKSMIGTTERVLKAGPDSVEATEEEVAYLVRVVNHYFPKEVVTQKNVIEIFAGSRVLPLSKEDANKRSRETTILPSPNCPGYYAIYGGKLTAYRATAEKAVNLLINERFLEKVRDIKTTRDLNL